MNWLLCIVILHFVKTWREWSRDIYTLWKFIFLRNYLTKFNGIFCKMLAIGYSFITWNYTSIYSIFWKLLMWKSHCIFFLGHTVVYIPKVRENRIQMTTPFNMKMHFKFRLLFHLSLKIQLKIIYNFVILLYTCITVVISVHCAFTCSLYSNATSKVEFGLVFSMKIYTEYFCWSRQTIMVNSGRGAFHQVFCQCFSLTNLLSANQMQGFQ